MARTHLPVVERGRGAISPDGKRTFVYPADVRGRFTRLRRLTFVLLVAFWVLLPILEVGGHPAVFLDVDRRQFFLFGAAFNAQDVWLMFFFITGVVFGLVYVTALLGRVWCGWGCPQTVFLDLFYRPIERLTEGPREKRVRLAAAPWTLGKVARRAAKHVLFVVASLVVSHIFVGYFVSLPKLWAMMHAAPSEHPQAFAWMAALTLFFYVNFGWFREQLCVIVCPYGRLQSVLLDDDSLVIGYDEKRGEPRGKVKDEGRGACVDCGRCVAVCPTGIDIRHGLQLDCIACAACIDACDEIMDKVGQPRGLVRYDSQNGLAGAARRVLRPRVYLYTGLLLLGVVVLGISMRRHHGGFEATLSRPKGMPFVVEDGIVRNAFEIQLVNKHDAVEVLHIGTPEAGGELQFLIPTPEVTLEPLSSMTVPVVVTRDAKTHHGDVPFKIQVRRERESDAEVVEVSGRFVGPGT